MARQQQKYQIFKKKCRKWPKIHTFSLLELESPLLSLDDINFLIISCEPLIVSFIGEVVAEADLLDFPPRVREIMSSKQCKIIANTPHRKLIQNVPVFWVQWKVQDYWKNYLIYLTLSQTITTAKVVTIFRQMFT